ncbi:MAG TPA: UDP-N-acetylmuramoyl-L-alanyl-D-glutamate--2,6-diaminopimelate ligase [Clostridiaceae bacterium]
MKISKILSGVPYTLIKGDIDQDINEIAYDSRKVKKGDIFICIEGFNMDGHKFARLAAINGAAAIVVMKDIEEDVPCIVIKVEDTRRVMALASANYYSHPERKLRMIGVTGTNGKTTTTFMLKAILTEAGYKVGIIGTIANYIGDKKIETHRTTPEALELFKLIDDMVKEGINYCIMEVSSHSLSLDRVYGINFSQAIFTNITQDHLDFHKTFEEYYKAKLKLFLNSESSVINLDGSYGNSIKKDVKNNKLTFSMEVKDALAADLVAYAIDSRVNESSFTIRYKDLSEKITIILPGKFNISNALGCIAVALNEKISIEAIKKGLNKAKVPGRSELISDEYPIDYSIYLDYAHTPDALQNILETFKELKKGRLISVFGCGGNRDREKRPMMGKIGTELSDIAIITSDNPRKEEPMDIIKEITAGIQKDNYIVIEDRKDAIKKALSIAEKDDVVVIAGKGHEDYQELKDKVVHFDEKEVINGILRSCEK